MEQETQSVLMKSALQNQCEEDPRRSSVEKETGLLAAGDEDHFIVDSFKKVVFSKLIGHEDFDISYLYVSDSNSNVKQMQPTEEIIDNSSLSIVGIKGMLPVGAVSIGTPRKSDSHAELVK